MKARKKSRSRLENWDEMTEFLALVSKPEIRWKNSRARLEARDWKKEILVLVSKHEIERKKISISSRSMRLEERNSRSRLGHEIERQIFSIPSRKLKQGSRWTLASVSAQTELRPLHILHHCQCHCTVHHLVHLHTSPFIQSGYKSIPERKVDNLSLIHIWRCRRRG